MRLTELALKNRPFTIVFIFLLVTVGITGYTGMPRSEDPYIEPPFATVYVVLPGASPEDLETLVLDPLDDLVRGIEEIEHTTGICRDGVAVLMIELEDGTDQDQAISEVEEKLAQASREFPDGIVRTEVQAWSSFHVRFVQIALSSDTRSYRELQQYSERLENRLQRISALQDVETFGDQREEIRVSIDPERLAVHQIPLTQVIGAIQSAGANIPGGAVTSGDRRLNILTSGDFESIQQIRRIVVSGSPWSPVYLSEVADIDLAYADRSYVTRINQTPCVLVTARQKKGRNVFRVVDAVRAEVEEFEVELPPDIQLTWVFDQSMAVRERLGDFLLNLGQGMLLVGLVVFLALGFRPASVVMLAIPFSFTIAIGFIGLAGFSVQQMTITALIIALGLLVDNGIVVTENINTFLVNGYDRFRAALEGTSQVGWAVTASTVTTVLAFVPIALMKDMSGDFIRSMPISVMLILASSLLIALTFSPLFASRVMKPITFDQQPRLVKALYRFVKGPYHHALVWGLNHRWAILGIATLTFACSIAILPFLRVSLFPTANKPIFFVDIHLPRGSSLDATDRALRFVENVLENEEDVVQYNSNLGRAQPSIYYNMAQGAEASHYAQVYVTTNSHVRGEGLAPMISRLRRTFAEYPGATIEIAELEQGPGGGAPIEIRLYSDDINRLETASLQVEDLLNSINGVINVNNPVSTRSINMRVHIDRDKAALLGIQLHEIDLAVRTAIAGTEAGAYRDRDGDNYPVVVRLPAGEDASMEDLMRVYVPSTTGQQIPLAEIASLQMESGQGLIQTRDGQRMIEIGANRFGRPTTEIETEFREQIENIGLADGVRWEMGGEAEARGESFSSMYQATSVAIIGIYAVLVLMFRSFRQPLIIYAALPLAFIGSIIALFITGHSFSFTAFVGLTSLVGIVVNNSILLVDMSNQNRRTGMKRREAIVASGESRFVPIVLTTATTVFGLLPLTLRGGSLWGPMGWVIIGGLLTSTVLTLLVVPVLYELFFEKHLQENHHG